MKLAFGNALRVLLGVVIASLLHGCNDSANSASGNDAQLTVSLPHASSNHTALKVAAPDYIQTYTIEVLDADKNVIVPSREIPASGGEVSLTVPPNTALQVIGVALDKDRKSRFSGNKAVLPIAAGTKASVSLTLEALSPLGLGVQATEQGPLTVAENAVEIAKIETNAQPDQHLKFSITGGADQRFFEIGETSGQLSFKGTPPTIANPQDAGSNNEYEVQVTFTDGFESVVQDLKVEVVQPQLPGSVDTGFGASGVVTTDIGLPLPGAYDEARAVVVQKDGKIVVAGTTGSGMNDFALARYHPNGTLDDSFGTQGKVVFGTINASESITAMALQPEDGKIVVAGTVSFNGDYNFMLARFDTDGKLDGAFGNQGRVVTDLSDIACECVSRDEASALVLQADGNIVVVGDTSEPTPTGGRDRAAFAIARYDSHGSLDRTFGFYGIDKTSIFDLGTTSSHAAAVTLQGDTKEISGKIIVAGSGYFATRANDFVVVRVNRDGTPDYSFGTNGIAITDFGGSTDLATGVVIQPDKVVPEGKIVVIGSSYGRGFALARYNNDGRPDDTFGPNFNGQVTDDFAGDYGYSGAHAVALQSDGKLVLAGESVCGDCESNFAVARYGLNGDVDMSFGTAGHVINKMGSDYSIAYALALQTDGKIVAAGGLFTYVSSGPGKNDIALLRYNP